jgi:broad specificity phosphatase PhoE
MTDTRHLLLIKHSLPEPIADLDANRWHLSDAGRPKARETGELVGRALGVPVESAPDLNEHDRTGIPWLGQVDFEAAVRLFFERPNDLVFGGETAHEAETRFSGAVEATLTRHPTGTVAIVAHGAVISLYVAAKTGIDACQT